MLATGGLPRKAGVEMAYGFVMCGVRSTHDGMRSTYNAQKSTHSGAKKIHTALCRQSPIPLRIDIFQTYI